MRTDTSAHDAFNETIARSMHLDKLQSLAEDYHSDPDVRAMVESDPKAVLAKYDVPYPPHLDIRIVANTDDIINIVMPDNPNMELTDESLMAAAGAGGKCMSSAGTLGTASTIASTASTASTVGSAGSAS